MHLLEVLSSISYSSSQAENIMNPTAPLAADNA